MWMGIGGMGGFETLAYWHEIVKAPVRIMEVCMEVFG